MKPVETSGNTISGVAKVEIHPTQPKVRVTFKPTVEGEKPKAYTLEKEDCPEYVKSGVFIVNLSGNGKKMYSIRPVTGIAKFRVKEFIAQKDPKTGKAKEPEPKLHNGKYGPYMTFSVSFEIVEGENKGMIVPGSFPFDFIEGQEEIPGQGLQSVLNVKKKKDSKYNDALWEFLKATGIAKITLPYKENPLPMLQRYILKENRVFSGAFKDGWMTSLISETEF